MNYIGGFFVPITEEDRLWARLWTKFNQMGDDLECVIMTIGFNRNLISIGEYDRYINQPL